MIVILYDQLKSLSLYVKKDEILWLIKNYYGLFKNTND